MRIRTVKPEFWKNPDLARLGEFTRLLALALLNYADDEGFFVADPVLMRGELFPFLEGSRSIQVSLTELANVGYVELYNGVNGRLYGKVATFKRHQRINRPSPSKIKECIDFSEGSLSAQGVLTTGTGNREGEQGTCLALGEVPVAPAPERGGGRARDLLFDTLAASTDGDPRQLTAPKAKQVGVALAQIRKVCPELRPEEIERRAANYRLHMPNATLTATALSNNWAKCDAAPQRNGTHEKGKAGWL